ncbi:hypothetical protein QN277_001892 [Acacia crassicarpa]|uniref:C2H2-type domain-containing protein n=1 Tax=Acacia crassicarpa TaxID=499986 RepID=A0AAE1N9P6_9FABA|nr:hypothetical protein QN277_001892 [Acacia crassicarpa]
MGKKKKINNNGGKMCMICKRWFASGKAVGGHMKAHFVKLPIPPKPAPISPIADQVPSKVYKVDVNGGSSSTHQCPEQNFHPMNHQDFAERDLKLVDDDQGSAESDQSYMTRKRFKRSFRKIDDPTTRELIMWPPSKTKVDEDNNPKQTGLIFDSCFPALDAALTLMLLSKEKWPQGKELSIKKKQKVKDNENEQEDSYAEDHSNGGGRPLECEMGTKVFGSYQALGGHKASHKKFIKNDEWEVDGEFDEENGDDVLEDPKLFKCPHCSKVLGSSQGLGRHKKIHFPNAMKFGANDIDLNSPTCSSGRY